MWGRSDISDLSHQFTTKCVISHEKKTDNLTKTMAKEFKKVMNKHDAVAHSLLGTSNAEGRSYSISE